ncbi:Chaperone of endosialidase [Phytophthora infestans]|uniref:Chaperone of endosialidase n=1 Tax=Phytophthora infestans TaxID=4787 RepID=A0A833T2N1_PHYIN|nr:Chaperone of endosialidase [Phytophthora infestans]
MQRSPTATCGLVSLNEAKLSYLDGATPGTAAASKALVCDDFSSITGLQMISSNMYRLGSTSLDFAPIIKVSAGAATASKALILNSSGRLRMAGGTASTNCYDFYNGGSFKEIVSIFRDNDDAGLTIGTKAQTTQKCSPLLALVSGYDVSGVSGTSSAGTVEMLRCQTNMVGGVGSTHISGLFHGYVQSTNYSQLYTNQPSLNFAVNTSTTTSLATSNNLLLSSTNGVIINSLTPANSSNVKLRVAGNVCVGSNTQGDMQMNVLDNGVSSSNGVIAMRFGYQLAVNDCITMAYTMAGQGSSSNKLSFDVYGIANLASGRVGVGTGSPSAFFHVSGSVSSTLASTGVYGEYGSAASANNQLGPITKNISIKASDGILTSTSFFAVSDRRVKKDITELTLEESYGFVNDITPVRYRLKTSARNTIKEVGYIAQDLKEFIPLLTFTQEENLPAECVDDIKNTKLGVDFSRVVCYLHAVLKDLIREIDELKKLVHS